MLFGAADALDARRRHRQAHLSRKAGARV